MVDRFAEHRSIDDNGRVRRQHKTFPVTRRDRTRLCFSDATDIGVGHFTWMRGFVDVCMYDIEIDPSTAQQFRTSWRRRAQDDSLHPLIFTCDRIAGP